MSKYTKIIAALGVAAGLGVASLPAAGVFAATEDTVNLSVEVAESISLELDNKTVKFEGTAADKKLALNEEAEGDKTTTATVTTNAQKGYTVTINASDLQNSQGSTDDYKFAYAADITSGGWQVLKESAAVAKDATILDKSVAPASGTDTVTVSYKAKARAHQASGSYAGTVTFTAAAKN